MQQHLFFFTKRGHRSIGDTGIAKFCEVFSRVRGTDIITPYQLIDDSFLEIIKEVAKVTGSTIYQLMEDQKGQYCLLHLVPAGNKEAFSAVLVSEKDFKNMIDLLNNGIDYEEAKKEAFKTYVLDTDESFTDSPDTGNPGCLCSRCGERIYANSAVIRKWPKHRNFEYRYHPACLGMTDPGPVGCKCEKCGHLRQDWGYCVKCHNGLFEALYQQFTEDI